MLPRAVESEGRGFSLFGGKSYFFLVLSSLNSPSKYPSDGKILLFIKVPLFKT